GRRRLSGAAAAAGRREHPGPPHRPGSGGGGHAGGPPGAAARAVPAASVRAARAGAGAAVHRYRADRWLSSTVPRTLEWSVRCLVGAVGLRLRPRFVLRGHGPVRLAPGIELVGG